MTAPPLLVSIVIASYNYDRFLPQAIDSALGQTYPHVEVIVVDDGSTDGSPAVMAGYGSAITAIRQDNGGHTAVVNTGFAASRGELVMFLDADDMLLPHAVEQVVAAYRAGVGKIQFRLQVVDAEGVPTGRQLPPAEYAMPEGSIRELLLMGKGYPCPPTSGNAYARWVLQRLVPLPGGGWRMHSDDYLAALVPLFAEIVSIPEACGLYRLHGENVWGTGARTLEASQLAPDLQVLMSCAALIHEWATREGLAVGPHLAYQCPGELTRMVALKQAEPDHPLVAEHDVWWLAWRGLAAIVSEPFPPGPRRRLAMAAWFVAMALLPRPAAVHLANWAFFRRGRSAKTLAASAA